MATATELAGSTKAVAGCQQWVEAKTRHLQNQCHDDNSEEVGGDINGDYDGDDDDGDDGEDYDNNDNDDDEDDEDQSVGGNLPRQQGAKDRASVCQNGRHLGRKCKCRRLWSKMFR